VTAARPPRPRAQADGTAREFVVWVVMPPRTWIQLPQFLAGELPARGPVELWLQHDGCCGQSSQAEVEATFSGDVFMTRGWGAITRACGSKGRHALHFNYDGAATLFFKVFGEDGGRLECCPASGNNGGELALGHAREASSSGDTSSRKNSSGDDYDEPPRCRARVKEEEDTD
jgi:hypothetical protein